jgi:hypothetical protein
MTESMIEAVKVHISGSDVPLTPKSPGERRSSFRTIIVQAGSPVMILGHIPNRLSAVVTVIGNVATVPPAGTAFLCSSQGDADLSQGAVIMPAQVVPVDGTDEVWISATDTVTVGVISVFGE